MNLQLMYLQPLQRKIVDATHITRVADLVHAHHVPAVAIVVLQIFTTNLAQQCPLIGMCQYVFFQVALRLAVLATDVAKVEWHFVRLVDVADVFVDGGTAHGAIVALFATVWLFARMPSHV